jgi:group I intron endonuclease
MIIYKTINLINGKSYIGKDSKNNPNYLGSGIYLNSAIKKYGRENFKKEIIALCYTKEHLNFLEKFYIQFCNTKAPNGYNLADGGIGFDIGHGFTEEARRKMSETRKGMHPSEESNRKRSETIKKIALTRPKNYYQNFISASIKINKGSHHSEEHKKKISESNKGKRHGRGKGQSFHHSEETKLKISNSKKGHIPWNKKGE